ncbi:hypothetical protein BJ875DRAFT_454945, partial [Amylocarpus encephaloides]
PVQHPPSDVFDDLYDEQSHSLLGSLQLEADEEPVRRGASRANSVRFDVSALHGANWNPNSRTSGDLGPMRPGSGIGSHPMTERSSSHKSDGRHSSAGHSVHSMHSVPSGRTSSLGLDTNFNIGGQDDDSPLDTPDPPPGLFILGSVPSIIRCWLGTDFSHNALLYADVCSGSQRSVLDYSLIKELGYADLIQKGPTGRHHIRLPVYLPEAVITQPTSRSNSPAPQLPTLSADFEIVGLAQRNNAERKKGIRIILGSDTLRAHSADILFSQNLMTLYGDDRNKLSVPFVRPEDENLFTNLCTANIPIEKNELKATAAPFTPIESKSKAETTPQALATALSDRVEQVAKATPAEQDPRSATTAEAQSLFTPAVSETGTLDRVPSVKAPSVSNNTEPNKPVTTDVDTPTDTRTSAESNRRDSSVGIWGPWRQTSTTSVESNRDAEITSGYQRAARNGRSMKVLKPSSKSVPSIAALTRPISTTRTGSTYEPAPSRPAAEMRRKSQVESVPLKWESKRILSEEQKIQKPVLATMPRSENPIGGASAFSWMTPGSKKATTAE